MPKIQNSLMISIIIATTFAAAGSLESVVSQYRKAKLVTMEVSKTVKSKVLGKENKFFGKIYISQSKFRWDSEKPDKSQIIFDGETIWNVQPPDVDLPGPTQVAKSKIDNKSKNQIIVSTLISGDGLDKHFKTVKAEQKGSVTTYTLESKTKDLGVKDVLIKTNGKKITELNFKDDIGNETHFEFSSVEFSKKSKPKLFKYSPPKGAQVSNL